jgi:DNA-binding IclR family transcriptional regulator
MIESLQRALNMFRLFDEQAAELGITEIAERLGLHKSTAAGLMYTLEHNDYLDQDPETRKYSLGFKLVECASTLLEQFDVGRAALPLRPKGH